MTPEKRYSLNLQEQDRLRNNKPVEETIQRNSNRVMTPSQNNLSSLHNPLNNPFNSQLAKDTDKLLKLNDRKEKMKVNMSKMISDLTPPKFDRFESTMIEYQLAPRS